MSFNTILKQPCYQRLVHLGCRAAESLAWLCLQLALLLLQV